MILEKQKGYSRLIYLSCIEKPRTRMDLTRAWNLSVSGRPLYREDVKETLQQLRGSGFIRKTGNGLKSQFNDELIDFLEKSTGTELLGFNNLLNQEWVREEVFSLENLMEFYSFNPEASKLSIQRTRTMFLEPFQVFILANIMHENQLNGNADEEILVNLLRRNIFYGNLNHNIILDSALKQLEEHSEYKAVEEASVEL